jgi:hypothetical protein
VTIWNCPSGGTERSLPNQRHETAASPSRKRGGECCAARYLGTMVRPRRTAPHAVAGEAVRHNQSSQEINSEQDDCRSMRRLAEFYGMSSKRVRWAFSVFGLIGEGEVVYIVLGSSCPKMHRVIGDVADVKDDGGRQSGGRSFNLTRGMYSPRFLMRERQGWTLNPILMLALFRFCSSDGRNTRQRHDISRLPGKFHRPGRSRLFAARESARILAYNAGVGGSNPSPPTTRRSRSPSTFRSTDSLPTPTGPYAIPQKSHRRARVSVPL